MTVRQFLAYVATATVFFFLLAVVVHAAPRQQGQHHHRPAHVDRAPYVSGTIHYEKGWHRDGGGHVVEHWAPVARSTPFLGGCKGPCEFPPVRDAPPPPKNPMCMAGC